MPGYLMRKKEIRIVDDEFKRGHRRGRTIFVCSGIDMFCEDVPSEMIERVLNFVTGYDNEYLFQSKNPGRFFEFKDKFPKRTILGTTIETNSRELINEVSLRVPPVLHRALAMGRLPDRFKRMVSVEPIMDFDPREMFALVTCAKPGFVSIGADSKGHGLKEPSKEKIEKLMERLSHYISVYKKENLQRLLI
jgi:DNA repair photolyase